MSDHESVGKKNYKYISELDFGLAMVSHKNNYPLEVVSVVVCEDEKGTFFVPLVYDYVYFDQGLTTGNKNGYESREQLMRCVGRCWDKAIKYFKNLESEYNKNNNLGKSKD